MIRIVNVFTQSEATLPMDRELEFRLRTILDLESSDDDDEEEEELEGLPLNH